MTLMRIVILEDSAADLRLFKEALHAARIFAELYHFPDGISAIESITSSGEAWTPAPDLIVLDIDMPRMTGLEVLEILRSSPRFSKVPVAVFTSSRSPGDMSRARDLRADRFIVKPTTLVEFFEAVRATVREFSSAEGPV